MSKKLTVQLPLTDPTKTWEYIELDHKLYLYDVHDPKNIIHVPYRPAKSEACIEPEGE